MNITINSAQLEEVFSHFRVIIYNRDWAAKENDQETYQKYLSEFCGIFTVLVKLGLYDEWIRWNAHNPETR